jgi:thiol reductant ABC exporter CydD subunit
MRMVDPRLLRRAKPARRLLALDAALGVFSALLVLLQAVLLARIVARSFHGATLASVLGDVFVLALVFACRGALAWSFEVAGRRAAHSVLSELRLELVRRRVATQPAALDGVGDGEIVAAAVQGVDALEAYFARYLPQVVLACTVPFAVLALVATIDVTSALLMLVTLPLVPVFMWLVGRYTEARTRERWLSLRLLSTHFLDVVRGLPTLRALNRSSAQAGAIADVGERYRSATIASLRVGFLSGSVLELAATLGVALVAVTVGVRLVGGGLGLEAGLTVLILAPELYLPLRQLGAQYHASADGLAVADRILDLLDAPAAVGTGSEQPAPSPATATVRLENVTFAYPGRAAPVLDGFDLQLRPGEVVALIGPSGAGKSTVGNLLIRLVEPTSGRISVGDIDLIECDPASWRDHVAWVPQRPSILRATVAENIRLGRADATDGDVRDAAALAGADAFVSSLPKGYATIVGDGGRALSAGERRRIALARAFLRGAALVILDEPTADLDPKSADVVAEAIGRFPPGTTVLLIAHRPELIRRLADRIVYLGSTRTADPRSVAV